MSNEVIYGDLGKGLISVGVPDLNVDDDVVEAGKVYNFCSFESSTVERNLVFEKQASYIVFSPVTIEYVDQDLNVLKTVNVESFLLEHLDISLTVPPTGSELVKLGVRFSDSVRAQITFYGEVFGYPSSGVINFGGD